MIRPWWISLSREGSGSFADVDGLDAWRARFDESTSRTNQHAATNQRTVTNQRAANRCERISTNEPTGDPCGLNVGSMWANQRGNAGHVGNLPPENFLTEFSEVSERI